MCIRDSLSLACAPRPDTTAIAPRETVRVPAGTLGVVRVLQQVGGYYDCEIAFALSFPETAHVRIPAELAGPLVIFDERGSIGVLGIGSGVALQPACAGTRNEMRAAIRTTLRNVELERPLKADPGSKIAAFVLVSDLGALPDIEAVSDTAGGFARRGDVDGDGRPEALLRGECAALVGARAETPMECCR